MPAEAPNLPGFHQPVRPQRTMADVGGTVHDRSILRCSLNATAREPASFGPTTQA